MLEKFSHIEWWDCVVKGHPTIDVSKIEPENSSLKDLDGETRAMVEKMMFDQRQRMLNLPDSEALSKQEAFEKFKRAVSPRCPPLLTLLAPRDGCKPHPVATNPQFSQAKMPE